MTAVRPPVWPTATPPASGGAGNARAAAQKAFFEQALTKAAPVQAQPTPVQAAVVRAETRIEPAAQRVQSTFVQPTEQPRTILRPGSLLDIKV